MRAYRLLLHLLPASFRLEYGDEMAAVFARRRRDADGPPGRAAVWLSAASDVVSTAVRVHLDILRQDLRYTVRTLRRAPGFALTVVAVSALGIGATTAAFSIADHVLLRSLPFRDADRLVKVWQQRQAVGYNEFSPANYRDARQMSTSFDGMGIYHPLSQNLVGDGEPERLEGAAVSAELFPLLGLRAALGRTFNEADEKEGAPATVLISHGLWNARFGADPSVLGRTLKLDDAPVVVIGIMPPDVHFPTRDVEFWRAKQFAPRDFEDRNDTYLRVVARLKPGVSVEAAGAEMKLVADRLEQAHPDDNAKFGMIVMRMSDEVSTLARQMLYALLGASACVLLVACANLAGLLLARGVFRRKELAVRTALGAGRERLLRQLLTESVALAAVGGALGVLIAATATPLVARLVPNVLPIAALPRMDLRLLAFAVGVTLVTGIGFGVVPARWGMKDPAARGLREGGRSGVGGRRERFRSGLVMAEVTVSVVLLVSCGLLVRALWRVQGVDPGFRADGVLTLRTTLPLPKYAAVPRRQQFYERVLGEVRALPGVTHAAYVSFLPMVMRGGIWSVEIEGKPREKGSEETVSLRYVTPGFFAAMGVPLRTGRDVRDSDTREAPAVAVVSESLVRRNWPGEDPLGRRFKVAFQDRTVVGVVGDVRVRGLERASEPQVYLPSPQVEDGSIINYVPKDLVIRTGGDPGALLPDVRRIVARADPEQPISNVRPLSDIVAGETAPRAVQVRVLGAFAGVAVLLAGIGIHGLLAFAVSSRAQEIGVRMALGAERSDILRMILRQGVRLAVAGVVAGVAAAYGAGRLLEAILAGVSPRDTATFLVAALLVLGTAFLGSLLPAVRAVRVDPLTVMRTE
jgi:putative ABC transport system permease protein